MTTWNHRIIKHADESSETAFTFMIHEVYYDGEGKPHSYTEDAVGMVGDDVEELRRVHQQFARAFDQPVLTPDDFKR